MVKRYKKIGFLFFFFFLTLCCLMICLPPSRAAESVGKFTKVEGTVDVLREGNLPAIPVKVGDPIFVKDVIRTKSNSRAEIIFVDGNTIKISQRSRIDVSEYLAEENRSLEILKLQRGRVEATVLDKNAKRISLSPNAHKFEIHTPCAVTGVRGTKYWAYQLENCATIGVQEGVVYAYNPKFPEKIVDVRARQITRACEDSPFFKPIDDTNIPDLIILNSPPAPGTNPKPPITDLYPGILIPRARPIPTFIFD
jgi:hypothetical protein